MNPDRDRLDLEFALQAPPDVRLGPEGFGVGAAPPRAALCCWIRAWAHGRKFFRDHRLVCWSSDGVRGAGGKRCEGCADRSRCTPRIRLVLDRIAEESDPATGGAPACERHTLELNFTSCRNFLAYARRIEGTDGDVARVPTRLTVMPHETWGEVRFEVDADHFQATDPVPAPLSPPSA